MAKSCAPSNIAFCCCFWFNYIQTILYALINLSKRNFLVLSIYCDSNSVKLLQAYQVKQPVSHYKIVYKLWSLESISLKCWLIDKTIIAFIPRVFFESVFFVSIAFAGLVTFFLYHLHLPKWTWMPNDAAVFILWGFHLWMVFYCVVPFEFFLLNLYRKW